jgi:hypothetical protein
VNACLDLARGSWRAHTGGNNEAKTTSIEGLITLETTTMRLVHLILVSFIALLSSSFAAPSPAEETLQPCQFDTEIQFYNVEFSMLDLPEECHDKKHLTTLGFMIQVRVRGWAGRSIVFVSC